MIWKKKLIKLDGRRKMNVICISIDIEEVWCGKRRNLILQKTKFSIKNKISKKFQTYVLIDKNFLLFYEKKKN